MRPFLSILTIEMLVSGLLLRPPAAQAQSSSPITPIQHVVVIFQENVSFDHYFTTYPNAANPEGETTFTPRTTKSNRTVNGITQGLMEHNPNHSVSAPYAPFRLDPSQNYTCDQDHNYTPEQQAFD